MNEDGVADIAGVVAAVSALLGRGAPQLIGVDGPGASGKSTLARLLAQHWPQTAVVHMDDFHRPGAERVAGGSPGENYDRARIMAQVHPLRRGRPGRYQRYDWDSDALAEWHDVPAADRVIVEGVYSTSAPLRSFYDVRLWATASYDLRLRRGLARDGESMRTMWTGTWMPAEQAYLDSEQPDRRADLVIDSSGGSPGLTYSLRHAN